MRFRPDTAQLRSQWLVWHVPTCRRMERVLWVDDELALVATVSFPDRFDARGQIVYEVHQHRRVVIAADVSTVFVDPVDDDPPALERPARVAVELMDWEDFHAQRLAQIQLVTQAVCR